MGGAGGGGGSASQNRKPWLYIGTSENDRRALNYLESRKIDFISMPVPPSEVSNEKPPKVLYDLIEYEGFDEIKRFVDDYGDSLPKKSS